MFNSETAKKAKKKAAPRTENKTNRIVKDVFAQVFNDLQDDPKANLKEWALKNQKLFYSLVTKLIPVQLDHAGEVVQRIIIEDAKNCQPLTGLDGLVNLIASKSPTITIDESNPGI